MLQIWTSVTPSSVKEILKFAYYLTERNAHLL